MFGHTDMIRDEVILGKLRVTYVEDNTRKARSRCIVHVKRRCVNAPTQMCHISYERYR